MSPLSRQLVIVAICLGGAVAASTAAQSDGEPEVKFSRSSVDFGIVCSDVKKSVAFYRDVVGLREIKGFDVPAELASDAGLADSHGVHIHVLVCDETPDATRIKLMQFEDAPGAKPKNDFIHSSLGLSYTTFWVADMKAALDRLKSAGVGTLAKSPVELAGGLRLTVVRDPDGNFVELVGP